MAENTNKIDTGGAAFPTPAVLDHDTGEIAVDATVGMTLRDWFAGQAMAIARDAYFEGRSHDEGHRDVVEMGFECDGTDMEIIAENAYSMADAMIAIKRRTEGGAA